MKRITKVAVNNSGIANVNAEKESRTPASVTGSQKRIANVIDKNKQITNLS